MFAKRAVLQFDQRQGSSDGGAILLKGAERSYGLVSSLAGCLEDNRQAGKVDHTFEQLLAQRVFSIACGYPDGNDSARLGADPVHKMLLDRDPVSGLDLASQPTLSRFENAAGAKELYRMGESLAFSVMERHRPLPIPGHVRLIICNSMVKHEHAGGQYNARRDEVEEGTGILRNNSPSILALRDATEAHLMQCRQQMPENVFRRCRHIITENRRVELAASALDRGDPPAFGIFMAEAHRSLRDDFEASCSELDTLVEIASGIPGCYGARMTGGGFGGCTVNLVEQSMADQFQEAIHARYRAATGIDSDIFLCRASTGAARIN